MEILSPGNLLEPLTINKLIKGRYEPCSRNPTLAQYLGHLRLMEQRGSGIRRMHSEMIDHGLESPEYTFRDGYFTVTLHGPGEHIERIRVPAALGAPAAAEERLTPRQRNMARALAAGKILTSAECRKRYGVSGVVVARDFQALLDSGIAERVGKGRGTRYVFRGRNR